MNEHSIYKKYLFYLISPIRNTKKRTIHNNIYIPSPLSKCINVKDIHLLNLLEFSDKDLVDKVIDIFYFDDNFHIDN